MGRAQDLIRKFLKQRGQASPRDLAEHLQITPQALHRHLKKMLLKNELRRVGSPPHVFYMLELASKSASSGAQISPEKATFLENHYTYINPQGVILSGLPAFEAWSLHTKQHKQLLPMIDEYIKQRNDNLKLFNSAGLIDASAKFQSTFKECALDEVFYSDFYSLPKFGKTRLGALVLHSKQAQDARLIAAVAQQCRESLMKLIATEKVTALVWVPHSLPRQVPFLKEFRRSLKLGLPEIEFVKAYAGEVPVAQKSLSKLEERIENANGSIFPKSSEISHQRILVIDDAVGSGSTLEAVANKIKKLNPKAKVFGYAVVGSLKGFEVIREV